MSKYIVISDTHFHNWSEFSRPDDTYVNSRLREQIESLQKVFDVAQEEGATIIFAGDMFHKRQSVDTRVFNAVYETFENNSDIPVYGIPGNHDKVTNSLYSESSIDVFDYIENTHISTSLEQVDLGDTVLTMIPYGDEVEEIKEYLEEAELDEDKTNILVAHLGVSGSITGKGGHRLEGAFTYEDLQPERFDFITLGHYHRPQILHSNKNHVYVGVLTQNTFNEEEHATGAVLINTDTNTLERIEIPSTKFKTVLGDEIPEDIEEILETHYVRFTGDRGQAHALENAVEDLSNVRINVEEIREIETRINISETSDPITITQEYMKEYYPKAEAEAIECLKEVL